MFPLFERGWGTGEAPELIFPLLFKEGVGKFSPQRTMRNEKIYWVGRNDLRRLAADESSNYPNRRRNHPNPSLQEGL
jgi:hypothetical protein